jgi:hypothetical protein
MTAKCSTLYITVLKVEKCMVVNFVDIDVSLL